MGKRRLEKLTTQQRFTKLLLTERKRKKESRPMNISFHRMNNHEVAKPEENKNQGKTQVHPIQLI